GDDLAQVLGDAAVVAVVHLGRRRRGLVAKDDLHPLVEVALRLQALADQLGVEANLVPEDVGVGREGEGGAGPPGRPDGAKLRGRLSAGEALLPSLRFAADLGGQLAAQRVHHRAAHAVQAAGVQVVALVELPARVEGGEDDLQGRLPVPRVDVDRDAAAVVGHGDRLPVLVEGDLDPVGVGVDDLVDAVVDDLPEQMVVAGDVGPADVHRRPLADRLQALEDLDVAGAVAPAASCGLLRGGHGQRSSFFSSGSGVHCSGMGRSFTVSFRAISRPRPPRALTSYFAGVSTSLRPFEVSSSMEASLAAVQRNARTRSSASTLITVTPRPGPASSLTSPALVTSARACSVTTARRSRGPTGTTPTSSSPSPGRA